MNKNIILQLTLSMSCFIICKMYIDKKFKEIERLSAETNYNIARGFYEMNLKNTERDTKKNR